MVLKTFDKLEIYGIAITPPVSAVPTETPITPCSRWAIRVSLPEMYIRTPGRAGPSFHP